MDAFAAFEFDVAGGRGTGDHREWAVRVVDPSLTGCGGSGEAAGSGLLGGRPAGDLMVA